MSRDGSKQLGSNRKGRENSLYEKTTQLEREDGRDRQTDRQTKGKGGEGERQTSRYSWREKSSAIDDVELPIGPDVPLHIDASVQHLDGANDLHSVLETAQYVPQTDTQNGSENGE